MKKAVFNRLFLFVFAFDLFDASFIPDILGKL